jgi:hypothetical protein
MSPLGPRIGWGDEKTQRRFVHTTCDNYEQNLPTPFRAETVTHP